MSNLRHWHARTTSATSSSTSATRRVAAAEELLRDFSKLDPLGLCPLSRCILLLPGRSLSFTSAVGPRTCLELEPTETEPPASVASAGQASTMAGSSKPARRIALQIQLQVGTFAPSAPWRPCRACASCPADRCLLAAMCCTPSWPPLREAHHGSRWLQQCSCLRSGSRTFYMLLDAVLHGQPLWRLPWQLPNSGSSVPAHGCCDRAGYLNCGLLA